MLATNYRGPYRIRASQKPAGLVRKGLIATVVVSGIMALRNRRGAH